MTVGTAVVIFAAGLMAGAINAVAGGGTLISFPVLVWAGRDPIVANATNALALWPGSLASAVGFRRELGQARRLLPWLLPPAIVGALAGAGLLIATPSATFSRLVPFLVLGATLLLAAQRLLARRSEGRERDAPAPGPAEPGRRRGALVGMQLLVSTYGGYFGAGMGIMMLAAYGLAGWRDIHQRNGVKNVLATVINGSATVYFVAAGAVDWWDAVVLAAGALCGGYGGAVLARRLGRSFIERAVIVIGLGLSVSLFLRG